MSEILNTHGQNIDTSKQFQKLTNIMWVLAVIVFILSLIIIIFKVTGSSQVSALRYNIIVGVSEIGNRWELLRLPLAGLLISAVNFFLAKYNKSNQEILALLASVVTLALNIILLLAALLLFQVN